MSESASESVADVRKAVNSASDEEREAVKARYREAEQQADEPRRSVLELTEPAPPELPEPPEGAEQQMYTREMLREGARSLFGLSPHVIAGALAGSKAETFTFDEARKLVEEFAAQEHGGPEA